MVYLILLSSVVSATLSWFVFDGRHEAELLAQAQKYESRIARMDADAKQASLDAAAVRNQYLTRFQEQQHEAEQAARAREDRLRRDLAAARSESDGMRDQLAEAGRRIASAAPAAVAEYATTIGELLVTCSRERAEFAEAADGHASDVQHHRDKWPRNPSVK